jgi:EmrB/QacA subfamily drug resistance transporter
MQGKTAHELRWWTLAVLSLSLLLITIDGTVVNTALPTLARKLDASASQLQWIVDAYTLVFAGLLLVAGSLGDRIGRQRTLAAGLVVFGSGSLVAALSGSAAELIASRSLMGVGAALIMPATLSILSDVFQNRAERTKAIGIWAGVSGLGVAIGPTLGGFLLEHFAWGSVFLVNLPIVAIALLGVRRLVPVSKAAVAPRLDPAGALLSMAGLGALTYGLIEAPSNGWTSGATIAWVAGALVLLGGFAVWELRGTDHPMVDLGLFRNRRFSAASLSLTIVFFSLFGSLFLLTQILQNVLGYSTLAAGAGALPFALAMGAASPFAAGIGRSRGTKLPVASGLLVMAVGLTVMSRADASSSFGYFVFATVLMGLGMGLAMAPATDSIMGALAPEQAGVGSAINDSVRNIGGVLGVAVIGSVATSTFASHMADAVSGLPAQAAEVAGGSINGAMQVAAHAGGSAGSGLASAARDAFMTAASGAELIAAAVALAGAALALRYLPAREAAAEAPGATATADSARSPAEAHAARRAAAAPAGA